jgi:hypothetical protein
MAEFAHVDWQTVVDAHPLESHDPEAWLRYGVALLQTLKPGSEAGRQLQQAALAFVKAESEGAATEAVTAAQRQAVRHCLHEVLQRIGIQLGADQVA